MRLGVAQVFRLEPVKQWALSSAKRVVACSGTQLDPSSIQALVENCRLDNSTVLLVPANQVDKLWSSMQQLHEQPGRAIAGSAALSIESNNDDDRKDTTSDGSFVERSSAAPPVLRMVPPEFVSTLEKLIDGRRLPVHSYTSNGSSAGCAPGFELLESGLQRPAPSHFSTYSVGSGLRAALEVPNLPGAGSPVAELVMERQRSHRAALELAVQQLRGGGGGQPAGAASSRALQSHDTAISIGSQASSDTPASAAVDVDPKLVSNLFAAAREGDIAAMRQLLSLRSESDNGSLNLSMIKALVSAHDPSNGATPLHHFVVAASVTSDDTSAVEEGISLLIAAGADVNAPAANGATPLHWAAGAGNAACVEALLKHGASPSARTYTWRRQVYGKGSGQTPAHWAAESNHVRVLQLLADASPLNCIIARDERDQTPIDIAKRSVACEAEQLLTSLAQMPYVLLQVSLEGTAHGWLQPGHKQQRQQTQYVREVASPELDARELNGPASGSFATAAPLVVPSVPTPAPAATIVQEERGDSAGFLSWLPPARKQSRA